MRGLEGEDYSLRVCFEGLVRGMGWSIHYGVEKVAKYIYEVHRMLVDGCKHSLGGDGLGRHGGVDFRDSRHSLVGAGWSVLNMKSETKPDVSCF